MAREVAIILDRYPDVEYFKVPARSVGGNNPCWDVVHRTKLDSYSYDFKVSVINTHPITEEDLHKMAVLDMAARSEKRFRVVVPGVGVVFNYRGKGIDPTKNARVTVFYELEL